MNPKAIVNKRNSSTGSVRKRTSSPHHPPDDPASQLGLMVSGRSSFELTQKALVAGMPLLAAVSAPSSLAVSLAQEFNMTLIGFLRGETFNIYSGEERITT